MKLLSKIASLVLLFSITQNLHSQDSKVRFGFIGNSITIGTGLTDPIKECYPYQIGLLLKEKYGDTCIVENFAVSGRTMLKHGDFPIWNEASFKSCWNYAPDICYIMLGTNDSKPQNWGSYSKEFLKDYKSMVDTFLLRNPRTKFIVCYPCPAYGVVWGIDDSIIHHGVMPAVDSIVKYANAVLIDFRTPLLDSVSLFPDLIHPNAKGAKVLAKIAYDKIVKSDIIHKVDKGYAYVTNLQSNVIGDLQLGDTATISWRTFGATEAFLNGQKVDLNGSFKVVPKSTTSYTLVAKSTLNKDSLVFQQVVYNPVLTKIVSSVSSSSIMQGDTISISLNYNDQKNKKIKNAVYDVNWAIGQGTGRFINKGENKIYFIADSAGKIIINIAVGAVTTTAKFSVTGNLSAIQSNMGSTDVSLFPNPVKDVAFFELNALKKGLVSIKVYDINGRLSISDDRYIYQSGNQLFELNTSSLTFGVYTYKLEFPDGSYSGKFLKE